MSSPTEDGVAPAQQASAAKATMHEESSPWSLRKLAASLVLLAAAIGFGLGALALYPATTQLPTPPYATIGIISTRIPGLVIYTVKQTSTRVAEIEITVQLAPGSKLPGPKDDEAILIAPPIGIRFEKCPQWAKCLHVAHTNISSADGFLTFSQRPDDVGVMAPTAFADIYVLGRNFGNTYSATTASVAVPEIKYHGPGTPTLLTQYDIPGANSYDWSSNPTQFAGPRYASWAEVVTGGQAPGSAAVGINHANQSSDDKHTFISGALLGLAGGALISAFQEFIHRNDH